MMRPSSSEAMNILPGWSRPFSTIFSGGTGSTPASDAMIRRLSSVRQYRDGRRPLRSRVAPIRVPSLKATEAGPSQGSMIAPWYS